MNLKNTTSHLAVLSARTISADHGRFPELALGIGEMAALSPDSSERAVWRRMKVSDISGNLPTNIALRRTRLIRLSSIKRVKNFSVTTLSRQGAPKLVQAADRALVVKLIELRTMGAQRPELARHHF